jgi:hypothetical protein
MRARYGAGLCALVVFAACSADPQRQAKSARSWIATAHWVSEARQHGLLPEAYAVNALRQAQGELQRASSDLQQRREPADEEVRRALVEIDGALAALGRKDTRP